MNKPFYRHGDLNFHPLTKEEYERLGEGLDSETHNGSFVLQKGEVTGHRHVITIERPDALDIKRLPDGRGLLLKLEVEGTVTHEDHQETIIAPGYFIYVPERELDHFAESVERKVVD